MNYRVELYAPWGGRTAVFEEVALLNLIRNRAGEIHKVKGFLRDPSVDLGHGYGVRIWLGDRVVLDAVVSKIDPQWSDTRKLVFEHYVNLHQLVAFEAERRDDEVDNTISSTFLNETVDAIVKRSIHQILGPIHYWVDHAAYPEGATREYDKLLLRKNAGNELGVGGITSGQWVSGARIDYSSAYAKDGDTITGLVVDGISWPDLRMMMIDTEESSLNSHTFKVHPEVEGWTAAQYDASGYKMRADAATAALQGMIDAKGIDLIELNPHLGSDGNYDDRVDQYGRYLGLVYGDGECFNAGLVEQGHSKTYLYEEGKYHVPEMELKDFYSYEGVYSDSIEAATQVLISPDVGLNIFQWLSALCYAAGGYGWSMDEAMGVRFRSLDTVDWVIVYDPVQHALEWSTHSDGIYNAVVFTGNGISKTYYKDESIDAYGERKRYLTYTALSELADADAFVAGLLEDVAYPEIEGQLVFYRGDESLEVGDLIEVRNSDVHRVTPEVAGEWGNRFSGRMVARVASVAHELRGAYVETTVKLSSPLRSTHNPVGSITASQPTETELFQLRLDDLLVGLDSNFHLD